MSLDDIDPTKMSSVEAAALYLSDGQTTDPYKAGVMAEEAKNELDMDALQRAHLRRMMGVDFEIKIRPNKIHVSTRSDPYVTTWCRLYEGDVVDGHLTNEKAVDRLVDACARLKVKYDKEVVREAARKK